MRLTICRAFVGTPLVLFAVCFYAAGQDKPADPVGKSATILEEAIKTTPDAAERVRLTRALLAMKAKSKPVKVIELAKGATLEEGALRYTFTKATKSASGGVAIEIKIENTSGDETLPRNVWYPRLVRAQLTDDTGRNFDSAGDSLSGDASKFKPGDRVQLTMQFQGVAGDKASEFYLELPHHHDKPDTILLIKKDGFTATK